MLRWQPTTRAALNILNPQHLNPQQAHKGIIQQPESEASRATKLSNLDVLRIVEMLRAEIVEG